MTDDVLFERRPGAAIIKLNRPEFRNSISTDMLAKVYGFLQDIEQDTSVRVVLMRGEGDHFCAGGDVKNFSEQLELTPHERRKQFEARVHNVTPMLMLIERMPQIFVTAVKGACAGVGFSFVSAADLAIASRNAFFVQAQIKLACTPDGSGSYWPVRAAGPKKAKELALFGDRFTADEAVSWGLLNRVVDDEKFEEAVEDWIRKLSAGPPNAMARTKRLINVSLRNDYATQLAREAEGFSSCVAEPDFAEGIRAFLEKRAPRFTGGKE